MCVCQEMSEREAYHLFFSTVEPPARHGRLYLGFLKINSVKISTIVFCKTDSAYSLKLWSMDNNKKVTRRENVCHRQPPLNLFLEDNKGNISIHGLVKAMLSLHVSS